MVTLLDRVAFGVGWRARAICRRARALAMARGWWRWRPLVPSDEFQACVQGAIRALRAGGAYNFGDYLEFGVSRGTSTAAMFHALKAEDVADTRLIGFDSFEGMPDGSEKEGWPAGAYASTEGATRRYLRSRGVDLSSVTLVKGWFNETLTPEIASRLRLTKASLLMVDCDTYSSSKAALWFSEPFIKDAAVILFDDWGWPEQTGLIGQREALAEFLEAFPDISTEPLPSYSDNARVFLARRGA